ncbi:MAG TPA: ABC transporter ATP-binding protein, partial [Candidatus Cloacimonadota bacterium]|nr:ABC transporter ATP-binding protein [Candidatus Cloacimonadota bacterium]
SSWHRLDLAKKIAMIPQELEFQFDYQVRELVLMGRFPYLSLWQNYSTLDEEIADKTFELLHLTAMARKYYLELSGGEKQRVLIARALVQQTDVILLDESLSQLDINYQIETMNLLHGISQQHSKLVILVSHNINLASNYCDTLYFLKDGKLVSFGKPNEVVNTDLLHNLYGIELEVKLNEDTGIPSLLFPRKTSSTRV